jgi:hypothetical protein
MRLVIIRQKGACIELTVVYDRLLPNMCNAGAKESNLGKIWSADVRFMTRWNFQTDSAAQQLSHPMCNANYYAGVKRLEREADH